ncbi:MAG: hypothetical protein GY928_05775 [Colwellia sp.]|nr:hypothetical protein [Colwellia sp.]
MSGFSKEAVAVENNGNGTGGAKVDITNDQWNTWNDVSWSALPFSSTKAPNGSEVKQGKLLGYVNFIMEIGNQEREVQLDSNLALPKEGEENSPAELARMESHKGNYFKWVDDYKDGEKTSKRKLCWKVYEEELVMAVDFPSVKVDYNLHPANTEEGENIKPLRIDYNGKWKNAFNRTIVNDTNWKTNQFGDKDIKYKITAANGTLEEYKQSNHAMGYLVQVPCSWTVKMSKKVNGEAIFYNTEIKDPEAVVDIQERSGVYTAKEQLADTPNTEDFCGILFNGEEDSYSKEQLEQARGFWWSKAMQAVQIDKNEGSNREGNWFKGTNWSDSNLAKACEKFEIKLPQVKGQSQQPQQQAQQTPAEKKVDQPKQEPVQYQKPAQFDEEEDQIPF